MALVVIIYVLLLLLLYNCFIYPAFLSPLAKIPNAHFTSPFSNFWIQWQRYRSSENKAIHEAHKRLGPIVRLGATELSVNSLDCVRTVYGDGFDRHEWYCRAFENYGFVVHFLSRAVLTDSAYQICSRWSIDNRTKNESA
jgi:hypothetical protein